MAVTDPATVAQNWVAGVRNGKQKYINAIQAVTKSPMAAAAAQQSAYLAGVQNAVASGKWKQGLLSVSLSDWQQKTSQNGANTMVAGATSAQNKMQNFFQQLLPYTANLSAQVKAMPKGSLEDSISRATYAITQMSKFRYQKAQAS